MTTLKLTLIIIPSIEILIFIWWLVRQGKKLKSEDKANEDRHMEHDDIPGRYVDIQYSERPFVEHY